MNKTRSLPQVSAVKGLTVFGQSKLSEFIILVEMIPVKIYLYYFDKITS